MKYYSEITKQFYDTEEAGLEAEVKMNEEIHARELAEQKKHAARKEAAAKVEAAHKAAIEANKAYRDELTKFCKEYGYYHSSVNTDDVHSMSDLIDWLFR